MCAAPFRWLSLCDLGTFSDPDVELELDEPSSSLEELSGLLDASALVCRFLLLEAELRGDSNPGGVVWRSPLAKFACWNGAAEPVA